MAVVDGFYCSGTAGGMTLKGKLRGAKHATFMLVSLSIIPNHGPASLAVLQARLPKPHRYWLLQVVLVSKLAAKIALSLGSYFESIISPTPLLRPWPR